MALPCGKVCAEQCVRGDGVFDGQTKERQTGMAQQVRVWYDAEADFLEVRFSDQPGFMRETKNDAVMERVDEQGRLLGFPILQVSRLAKQEPLVADLVPA